MAANVESARDGGGVLHHHRDSAIGFAARCSAETLADFLLHHDDKLADLFAAFEHVHDQRRRDVVGQIGDELVATIPAEGVAHQGVEVCFQRIGENEVYIGAIGEGFFKQRRQTAVDLDGQYFLCFAGDGPSQRAGAGADLQRAIAWLPVADRGDAFKQRRIADEILSVFFL